LPCEIRVVDEERREIEVCATSEAIDAHGTIFGYEASRDAFSRWAGNVREMHERKAVGRKVDVRYDDDARKVYVRVRISAGAQDTWEKVKDGTLDGASIGASNVEWRRQRVSGQDVPVAARYDLVELSLVDSPSNPDAVGVTFVRDGVPDEALLSTLDIATDAVPEASVAASVIREQAGALTTDDPAAAIAQAAMARGQAEIQADLLREAGVAAGGNGPEPTANELRLARLGAPGYVARVKQVIQQAAQFVSPSQAASEAAQDTRADAVDEGVDEGPGAMYDVDGDHDGSGNAAGLEHAAELHAHASHDHSHTGAYDDAHRHAGTHMHMDGTSHEHDHLHDHGHHDHASNNRAQERNQAGHSHGHVHTHDHGHYYRVADGAPLDERLVTGEHLRTREYVSEVAFRAAGGVSGQALTAAQYRIAAGVETRLEIAAAERAIDRAQGAFSRNPLGAADIGTPAAAAEASTESAMAASATGQVRDLDRDGQPTECDEGSTTGTLDVSTAPEGYADITDNRRAQEADTQRALASMSASIAVAVEAQLTRALAPLSAPLSAISTIEERLARIEAQPMPGGPILRSADRTSALSPMGGQGSSAAERIDALQSLAGRIADPQAQVAVAAEMIRLQQEAAGMSPAMQVMPRAGRGWTDGK
jgi:phage head maturation protease